MRLFLIENKEKIVKSLKKIYKNIKNEKNKKYLKFIKIYFKSLNSKKEINFFFVLNWTLDSDNKKIKEFTQYWFFIFDYYIFNIIQKEKFYFFIIHY